MPGVVELGVQIGAEAADGEVGIGLLAEALEGDRVEAAERVVVFAAPTAVEQVQPGLEAFVEYVAQAQVQRAVAVGIMVAVAGE